MAITFPITPVSNGFGTSSSSFNVSLASGVLAGDIIVVAGSFGGGGTGVALTDGKGDTPTIIDPLQLNPNIGGSCRSFVQAFFNPTATAITITATYSGGTPGFGDLAIWAIRGLTSPVQDKVVHGIQTGSGGADSGSSGTLTQAQEAAIAYCVTSGAVSAGTGGLWTFDGVIPNTAGGYQHQVTSTTAALDATFVMPAGANNTHLATFMSGVTGPTGGPKGGASPSWSPFITRTTRVIST